MTLPREAFLEQEEQTCSAKQQDGVRDQHQPGMCAISPYVPPVPLKVVPDHVAKAAHGDEKDAGHVHQPVRGKIGERAVAGQGAHQIKARVAERRYRMEQAEPCASARAQQRHKAQGQQCGAAQLYDGGIQDYIPCELGDPFDPRKIDALDHRLPLPEAHAPVQQMEEHGGDRHESEAPDLYEQEQYHLAEKGPFRSAASDKTGDTRGRGGRKQRGEQAWRASIRGGTG